MDALLAHASGMLGRLAGACGVCYVVAHMKRTNFYYPEAMLSSLKALSQRVGLPVSELIRRAIDAYLKEHKA